MSLKYLIVFFPRKAILIQCTRCGDSRHQTSTGVFDLLAVRYLQYCARHCLNSRLKEVFGHWITNPSRRDPPGEASIVSNREGIHR